MMYKFFRGLVILCLFLCIEDLHAQCPNNYTVSISRHPDCNSATNGQLRLQSSTYYSNSTYLRSNGATGRQISNLGVGHYQVTITDPTTCVYTASVYLPPVPVGGGVRFYANTCDGRLTAYPNGNQGTQNYTYQWSTGATTASVPIITLGAYSVTITSPSGCTLTGTYNPTQLPIPIQMTHTSVPASCNASDGSIDVTITGGTPPYQYHYRRILSQGGYSSVGTSEDLTNAPAGLYQLLVWDNACYYAFDTLVIGGPAVYLQPYSPSCGSSNNGGIDASIQGITSPTYLWSTGATTPSISNLSAGTYTVTVSDGSCTIVDSATITNAARALSVYIVDSSSSCQQGNLFAYAYGGAGNGYTYAWSNGATTQNITVGAGMYIVTATDRNGCTAVDTAYNQSSQGQLGVSAVVQDATCGNSDGAIDLTVTGSYSQVVWEPNVGVGEDLTSIPAGRYVVSFYNYGQCLIHRDTFLVGEFFETTYSAASCGLNNGSAAVTTYNMLNPTYQWSNGATTAAVSNLAAGTYWVTVTNGACVLTDSVVILDAGQVSASIQADAACQPSYLVAIPYGGATPHTYVWSTGVTTQSLTGPVAGNTYQVTISDANGCTASASYTVVNHPLPAATATTTPATCGNKNGSISLIATGGTPPYQYDWSLGGGNASTYIGVYAGRYTATVTDNNGCEAVVSNIQVGGGIAVSINAQVTQPTPNNNDGAIDLTVRNSTSPTFLWNTGATTEDLTNLSPGHYTVSVTDPASGCVIVRRYWLRTNTGNCGGQYAVISGYVYDVTASNTCQAGLPLPFQMVRLQPGGQLALTNSRGKYTFTIPSAGNYTVEYVNSSTGTTVLCPTGNQHTVAAVLGSCYTQKDFHLVQQPFDNLVVQLRDYSNATPGFPYVTRVHFCNRGNTVRSGTIEYDYNPLLDFNRIAGYGSTLTLHDIPNHKFYWSFAGLRPNQCRSIDVTFDVPPTTALGTNLVGVTDIFPVVGDVEPTNNTSTEQTTVVGAYDPNDKQVGLYRNGDAWNGGSIYTTDETLDYTIRFQNTGTAPANWVVIRDTLDQNLLPHTIRDLQSKHAMQVTIEDGNVLVFTFNNIYLPDSSADFEASIGFVQFTIDRAANLPIGTRIPNQAAIYFDYNPPIFTNQPVSIIDQSTSVVDLSEEEVAMMVQPNPFQQSVLLRYELKEPSTTRITVFDLLGQCVYQHQPMVQPFGKQQQWLNLSQLPSGMYLIRLEAGEQQWTKQLIKQ